MKEIVVKIDDSAYQRAEQIASTRNISVTTLVKELVEAVTENGQVPSLDVTALFAALDKARNKNPIGTLRRDELHDRPILH
jgi:antitoxin component of RelBE/YafQ-DinJ toxin-antitoxin module